MPFKSEAQRRLFHVKADKGEMPQTMVHKWEKETRRKSDLPYHVKKAYAAGRHHALQKLGFVDAIDPEDLPTFLAQTKRDQLRKLYLLNAATGLPAGGLIEGNPR